ncbi:MAG: hypothetical protein AB1512_20700 [Thermodesulfobacteriota bacterium]
MNVEKELKNALKEIGEIKPWWSEDDKMYVFEHETYPTLMHADSDPDEVVKGYERALRRFIQYRMRGQVAESVERITSGRGGYRPGAGRPKGSTKGKTRRISLPEDVAAWLKEDPAHIEKLRAMMK